MNKPRGTSDESRAQNPSELLAGDFKALKTESRRDVPSIQETARAIDRLRHAREGILMKTVRKIRTRPVWLTAGAVAAIAVALLFVPISYQQTVGQTVTLSLPGDLSPETVEGIARTLGTTMEAERLEVMGGDRVVFEAQVPNRSHGEVRAMASAITETLEERGIAAEAEVSAWTERVSGTLYAYATMRATELKVQTAGRSNFEIEQDIRSQLQNAGFLNPEISFSRDGNESRLRIKADQIGGERSEAELRHDVRGGAAPGDGEMGILLLDTESLKGRSDAEIKAEVERMLAERGHPAAKVTVENGEIRVEATEECCDE
jgi:hypothetical protein